jgi:hypothetical protein
MSTMKPTLEEQKVLDDKIQAALGTFGPEDEDREERDVAWEAGYEARQVRERESFSSAYGKRAEAVVKALIAITRCTNVEDTAVLRRATEFLDELEKAPRGSGEYTVSNRDRAIDVATAAVWGVDTANARCVAEVVVDALKAAGVR